MTAEVAKVPTSTAKCGTHNNVKGEKAVPDESAEDADKDISSCLLRPVDTKTFCVQGLMEESIGETYENLLYENEDADLSNAKIYNYIDDAMKLRRPRLAKIDKWVTFRKIMAQTIWLPSLIELTITIEHLS
ncbi:hypothetical protein BJV82DRAFT_581301 [Fennellomyces sp. T-0311]|nr:hypothetical protein BJV82DRAFT_581301 [Fennellomyces sp. T-0311]